MIDLNNVRIHRVLLWSGDRAPGGTRNQFVLQLPFPIDNAIHIEWLNASANIQGLLLQIEGWGTATTSSGRRYWRYLDSASNQRYEEWQTSMDAHQAPAPLRLLQISLFNRDGSAATVSSEHSVELLVYAVHDVKLLGA